MKSENKPKETNLGKNEGKIEVNNFKDILSFVDSDFKEVLLLLNKHRVFEGKNFKRSFKNRQEVLDFLRKIVVDYLTEKYSFLYNRISKLRKSGKELTETTLKLSSFKLKLKLFKVELNKHSFNRVIIILDNVEKELEEQFPQKEINKK